MMETALKVGTQVQGGEYTYTVEQIIGQGGFGITYKVSARIKIGKIEQVTYFAMKELFLGDLCERDHTTNRVKFSAPTREKVENSKKDFLSEARRLNSIDHPNVVAVNEVFETNDTAYYVMEYLTGDSLRRYIDKNGALSEEQTKSLIAPLLNAVNYLHDNRLTHLDIKPDNIMLKPGRDGELTPVLIDFGLSKHYDTSGNATSTVRMSGLSHGYAPLEQYEGITTFTPQADVYALAATMLYCMTGKDPVRASEASADWIKSVLPAGVTASLVDALCHAMRAIKPERTQSVADYARELGIALDDVTPSSVSSEILTQQIGKPKPGKKENSTEIVDPDKPKPSSRKWLMPTLIALGVIAVGVIVWLAVGMFNGSDIDSSSSSSRLPDKAVDLGLSVLWADRNVGASSPSDYGGYYAWGETSTKSAYSWDTYQYFHDQDGNGEPYDSKWNIQTNELTNIGSNISGSRYDVARQAWGGGWKLPTEAQWEELENRCTWTWTTEGGHSGYKVTGPNGNSIFLPAAGFRNGTSSSYVGSAGIYWSATLNEGNPSWAWGLEFYSGGHDMNPNYRYVGDAVRPVTEK